MENNDDDDEVKDFYCHSKASIQWKRGSDNPLIARSHVKWLSLHPVILSGKFYALVIFSRVLFIMSHELSVSEIKS